MLQQPTPDDYVVGMGMTHSVRELCEVAFPNGGPRLPRSRGAGREVLFGPPKWICWSQTHRKRDVFSGGNLAYRSNGWSR
jgi:GDP-D-mannose dehydratase